MGIFYHGTNSEFQEFDTSHISKVDLKGGYGVHVTADRDSALKYAIKKGRRVPEHIIYHVEVPDKTSDNYLTDCEPVGGAVVAAAERELGMKIPARQTADGAAFRKFIAKKLSGETKVTLDGERLAAAFLLDIGVGLIEWKNMENGAPVVNYTVLDPSKAKIVSVEKVDGGSFFSIAKFIKRFYNEYWGLQSYDADKCAAFSEVAGTWGIFGNFANTPIIINEVTFASSEDLFQMMKFKDKDVLDRINRRITKKGEHGTVKMAAKSYEKEFRREDWGSIVVDAMKFCLVQKYEQSEEFRNKLEQSRGYYIVEAQTKGPDSWGARLEDGKYVGGNLMGRLLMELRDNGKLEYNLPDDALDFIEILKK